MLALSPIAGLFGPAWLDMWTLAFAIFAVLKVGTWLAAGGLRAASWRSAAYLIAWPGMDAQTFLHGEGVVPAPRLPEWLFGASKLLLGGGLLYLAIQGLTNFPLLRAWIGMAGIVFVLHFGLFHLLSCLWRSVGIEAAPIMRWPVLATSLTDFWSRRWNLAFRDLTHRFVFRPLAARMGGLTALWIGFLISGLIHDAVVSLPARGGYGWPTLFFLLQAAGISLERSRLGRAAGLGRSLRGWAFAALVLVLPAPLLFHQPFREQIVLPMLDAIGLQGDL